MDNVGDAQPAEGMSREPTQTVATESQNVDKSSPSSEGKLPVSTSGSGDEALAVAPVTDQPTDGEMVLARMTSARRCGCCGSGWHRLSIWLFRFCLPIILIQGILNFSLCVATLAYFCANLKRFEISAANVLSAFLPPLILVLVELAGAFTCAISMRKEFFPCCCACCYGGDDGGRAARYRVGGGGDSGDAPDMIPMATVTATTAEHSHVDDDSWDLERRHAVQHGCLYSGVCLFVVQVIVVTIFVSLLLAISWINYIAMRDMSAERSLVALALAIPILRMVGWFVYLIALIMHFSSSFRPERV